MVRRGRPGYQTTEEYLRVDSVQGNIRVYNATNSCPWLSNERSRDSLSARFGDSAVYECVNQWFRCLDDSSYITRCGLSKRLKVYYWSYPEGGGSRSFAQDIGFVSSYNNWHGAIERIDLLGYIINGVLCGDTSLTGINIISTDVPERFSLYQNYPNPFNPVTKIRFDIPSPLLGGVSEGRGGFLRLIVYDILGKEVSTLVNEELNPGTYEVTWDAAYYPSGIYFYKLTASGFSETKRMVLTK